MNEKEYTLKLISDAKHLTRDAATVLSAIRFKINHHYRDKYPKAIRESTTLRLLEDIKDLEKIVSKLDRLTEKVNGGDHEKHDSSTSTAGNN